MSPDPVERCPWVDLSRLDYVEYHDREWGVPIHNDLMMFEFLILEGFQAGLSWYTILKRRNNFRVAFDGFDPKKIARYGDSKIKELLADPGIIRNRAKIVSAVNNAQKLLEIQAEFGSFHSYLWRFIDDKPIINTIQKLEDYASKSAESEMISKTLQKKGFSFVGPTIIYAHMQATGMVNDHSINCYRRREIMSLQSDSEQIRCTSNNQPPSSSK